MFWAMLDILYKNDDKYHISTTTTESFAMLLFVALDAKYIIQGMR